MSKILTRTLSQRKKKMYEDIEFSCTIRFLDDSDPLTVTYQKQNTGQWLIDHVCKELNLEEKDYFGLRFVDTEKQRHWVDPLKPLHKQLKQVNPSVLCFRVKFYPSEPLKLKEEITRYFLFLQLRRDLHHGRLLCSPQDANLLAGYIIQSEEGDYDTEEHQPGYVAKHKMLPKQTNKQEDKIAEIHRTQLSGQTPAESEANFITKAASLDTYGVDPHPVKDQKGNQMYLGVTHLGIVTFQGNKRTHLFKWPQITKIAFEGKMFIVHVTISEDSENSLLVKKKKHACGFKCPTFAACKHLWKCAVEQQYFFTLERSAEAPKVTSGGGFFSRGSKFRFSGRCQREVFTESAKINRLEPNFVRSCSNPTLVKSYNKYRSESLPTRLKEHSLNDSNVSGDTSMQSLTHGEVSFPNGSLSKEAVTIEQGMPEETPKQVSEAPYRPFRSPSREDLPAEPIPEVDIEGAGEEVLLVVKQLDNELAQQATPTQTTSQSEERAVEPIITVSQSEQPESEAPIVAETVNESPDSAQTEENQEELDQSEPEIAETLQPEQQQPSPSDQSEPAQANVESESQSTSSAFPTATAAKCCRILTFTFLLMFTVMSFVAVFVLESELDMPVLRDIRQMPEVQDFKHQTYNPFKTTVAQKMGKWFK